ncbi:hypothetical protein GCM10025770_04260 [Viridibacterium curvum]|uniref:Uncharacterized protein n=1 Tax=Viridibacterium curvum TaxID=1101404 RepID=A0ABP9Q951_9RHOO
MLVAVQELPPAPPVGKPPLARVAQPMTLSPVGGETEDVAEELLELTTLLDEEEDEDLLLIDDELEELEEGAELEVLVPLGTEHSLVPPATLVPAPKVTSPQTKLPTRVL